MRIAVIGAGSWGIALASTLHQNGHEVSLWARDQAVADAITNTNRHPKYLPGIVLPPGLTCTSDLQSALSGSDVCIFAVASEAALTMMELSHPYMPETCLLVHAIKGFEFPTLQRMSELLLDNFDQSSERVAVIAGPSHAEEVARQMPTTLVVAAFSQNTAEAVQDILMAPHLRVYTNPDVIGTEIGGTLKNIIALGVGIADGMGFGDNAKAALMTRGLAEITRLGIAMGASAMTFAGLSGVGDLIVTCTSEHSRNFRAGQLLGQGKRVDEAITEIGMAVEGIRSTRAAKMLSQLHNVDMPITCVMFDVLFRAKSVKVAVSELMGRARNHEVEEVAQSDLSKQWLFPAPPDFSGTR